MEKTFGDSFKEFLGERRTSPMYKSFIISWCLWNWNFLYIMFFESSSSILDTYGILKSDYLRTIYDRNFYSISHLLIGPIISIFLFLFVLHKPEIRFRKKANQNQINQIDTDQKLTEKKNKQQKIENDGANAELDAMIIKNKQLEEDITMMQNEVKKSQINKTIKKELTEEEKRDLEYEKIKSNGEFILSMKELENLIDERIYNGNNENIYNKNKSFYAAYKLLNKDINDSIFRMTDKGAYFLKKIKEDQITF